MNRARSGGLENGCPSGVYGEMLGISTEVVIGPDAGLPGVSAVRCDFLAVVVKRRLSTFVGSLSPFQVGELNRALAVSLDLPDVR